MPNQPELTETDQPASQRPSTMGSLYDHLKALLEEYLGLSDESSDFLFVGIPSSTTPDQTLEDVINLVNNFVMMTGKGNAPEWFLYNVEKLFAFALDRTINQVVIPVLDDLRKTTDELNSKILAKEGGSPAPPTLEASVSEPIPPPVVMFRNARYRMVSKTRVAIIQKVIYDFAQKHMTERIKGMGIDELKDMYNRYVHRGLRNSIKDLYSTLEGFRRAVIRSSTITMMGTQKLSLLDTKPLDVADHIIGNLSDQVDVANKLLPRIIELEKQIRQEKMIEEEAAEEQRLKEIEEENISPITGLPKGKRGRKPKVREEEKEAVEEEKIERGPKLEL